MPVICRLPNVDHSYTASDVLISNPVAIPGYLSPPNTDSRSIQDITLFYGHLANMALFSILFIFIPGAYLALMAMICKSPLSVFGICFSLSLSLLCLNVILLQALLF